MTLTRRELLFGGAPALAVAASPRPGSCAAVPATAAVGPSLPLDTTIGESPAITAFRDRLRPVLDRAARLSRPPGKDLAANVLHVAGRGTGQYVYLHSTCDPFVGLSAGPGLWKRAVAGPI